MSDERLLKPLHDYVVVVPFEETLSAGGIVIPETADKARPQKGKVLAVGPGKWADGQLHPVSVSLNATVLFGKYSGTEFELEGKKYLVMKETDILAELSESA